MTSLNGTCPATGTSCGLQSASIGAAPNLCQTLERFGREAIHGILDTGRYCCRYFTWGSGPPLIFIPGLSSNARSFALLMAPLTRHFRCVAYDLPTGTADDARLDRYTHDDLAADALAVLDHLGEPRGYLVGFSFGSTIALAALHAEPERWVRGVLVSGFARRPLAPAEVLVARLARRWRATIRVLPFLEAVLRRNHFPIFASRPPEVWRFFLEQFGSTPIAAVVHRALLIHRLDLRPILPAVHQPVLLVTGDGDPIIQAAAAAELRRGLPNALHVELPECGHQSPFTHAAELAELVRQYLSPPSCGQPALSAASAPGQFPQR